MFWSASASPTQRPSFSSAASACATVASDSAAVRRAPAACSASEAAHSRWSMGRSAVAHRAFAAHASDSASGRAMVAKCGVLPTMPGTVPTMSRRMRGQVMPR